MTLDGVFTVACRSYCQVPNACKMTVIIVVSATWILLELINTASIGNFCIPNRSKKHNRPCRKGMIWQCVILLFLDRACIAHWCSKRHKHNRYPALLHHQTSSYSNELLLIDLSKRKKLLLIDIQTSLPTFSSKWSFLLGFQGIMNNAEHTNPTYCTQPKQWNP